MTNRVNVLGVGIRPQFADGAGSHCRAVRARRKGYICVTGVHGVMEAQDDDAFKKF